MRITILLSFLTFVALAQDDKTKELTTEEKSVFVEQRSALLNDENRDQWILAMRAKLPMTTQRIGPFGKPQVESEKRITKQQTKREVVVKSDAFQKAVDAIKVNAVNSTRDKFFIGSREFRVGDVFPVVKDGNTFKTKVISIKSTSIKFQNVNNKEYVIKNLFDLPAGMASGSSLKKIDGVSPSGRNDTSPLNLD
ncbi:MAG: hypothetical protein ACSHX0_04845 [Akkermansiaceae bacterium]